MELDAELNPATDILHEKMDENKKRKSKRLEKKRQWKERRISKRQKNKKNGYFLCEKCNESHKIEEEKTDLLLDVLHQMQNQGQIPQNAKFEIDEESEEGGYFIRGVVIKYSSNK